MAICKWTYEDILRFERALDEGFEYHRIVDDKFNLRVFKVDNIFVAESINIFVGGKLFVIEEQDIHVFASKLSSELNRIGEVN